MYLNGKFSLILVSIHAFFNKNECQMNLLLVSCHYCCHQLCKMILIMSLLPINFMECSCFVDDFCSYSLMNCSYAYYYDCSFFNNFMLDLILI